MVPGSVPSALTNLTIKQKRMLVYKQPVIWLREYSQLQKYHVCQLYFRQWGNAQHDTVEWINRPHNPIQNYKVRAFNYAWETGSVQTAFLLPQPDSKQHQHSLYLAPPGSDNQPRALENLTLAMIFERSPRHYVCRYWLFSGCKFSKNKLGSRCSYL